MNLNTSKKQKKQILITVKTYPTPSKKYGELVCTAGITKEGDLIRIYPVPFRMLEDDKKYGKYRWIEASVEKNISDFRNESYKIDTDSIKILNQLESDGNSWSERRLAVLEKTKIYTNTDEIINLAKEVNKDEQISLAIFKPTKILDFYWKEQDANWDKEQVEYFKQNDLFDAQRTELKIVEKLPLKFYYEFEDENGKKSNLIILDWELAQLYRNCVKNYGVEKAPIKVKEKYFDNFAKTKDLYFFLGTSKKNHYVSKNPFMIIGVFYPKYEENNSERLL